MEFILSLLIVLSVFFDMPNSIVFNLLSILFIMFAVNFGIATKIPLNGSHRSLPFVFLNLSVLLGFVVFFTILLAIYPGFERFNFMIGEKVLFTFTVNYTPIKEINAIWIICGIIPVLLGSIIGKQKEIYWKAKQKLQVQ